MSPPVPRFLSGPFAVVVVVVVWSYCPYTVDAVAATDRIVFDDYYRSDGGPCEYYQLVEPGNRSYYLYSPGYPDPYQASDLPQNLDCRWFAKTSSPTDRLVLDCHEFDLPESKFCESDALIVSRVGDVDFADGVKHCGPRSFTTVSRTNKINVRFVSRLQGKGGRFMCSVGAKRVDYWIPEAVKNSRFCECGKQHQGVFVDEKTAGVNEFPLLASLIDGQTTNLFCGATVIGRHHALTAARCLTDVNPSQIALLVGDHDMADLGSDPSILIVITEIYIHPSYDPSSVAYDLAVVETYEEIPFSAKVGPACLPFKYVNNDFVGDTVKVLGWGSVNFEGPVSGPLQRSYLRVAPASRCAGAREQLCTHNSGKANNSCQVDTGGPILWSDPATGKLNVVGVVSDGRSVCADSTPSVQTRLATAVNMNWINTILTGQYYCN